MACWDISQSRVLSHRRLKKASGFCSCNHLLLFILLNNWFGLLPGFGTIGFFHQEETSEEIVIWTRKAVPAGKTLIAGEHDAAADDTENTPKNKRHRSSYIRRTCSHNWTHCIRTLPWAGTADLNTTLALALIFRLSHSTIRCSVRTYGLL